MATDSIEPPLPNRVPCLKCEASSSRVLVLFLIEPWLRIDLPSIIIEMAAISGSKAPERTETAENLIS